MRFRHRLSAKNSGGKGCRKRIARSNSIGHRHFRSFLIGDDTRSKYITAVRSTSQDKHFQIVFGEQNPAFVLQVDARITEDAADGHQLFIVNFQNIATTHRFTKYLLGIESLPKVDVENLQLSLHIGHGIEKTVDGSAAYLAALRQRAETYGARVQSQALQFIGKGDIVPSNTFFYLIIQVPIMLILGLMFASMLNNKDLRFKGLFRTCIFLPCATSLVSYAMIFRSLFANDGFINTVLRGLGMNPIMWFSNAWTARAVIIIALIWRWTGYNMVFYLSGMQNIEYSIYEAAKIDGASPLQTFFKITVPLLKPMILLTTITSTNGTLQLFDESLNLTNGGPGKSTMTMSHYIYNMSFVQSPNFGYAAAMSILILIMVAILALLQMKVGDER